MPFIPLGTRNGQPKKPEAYRGDRLTVFQTALEGVTSATSVSTGRSGTSASPGTSASTATSVSIDEAIERALPKTEVRGEREFQKAVFGLGRWLKAVPELSGKDIKELKPTVRKWCDRAGDRLAGRS